ncbi:MAG: serine hydrolase [Bryobacteraceae bacterium]
MSWISILIFLYVAVAGWGQSEFPASGKAVPELAAYETNLLPVLRKWAIPGAAVAITDQGRLVYARGFGFADREAGIVVQPNSLFRLASISKTFTGMTILRLAQEGKLSLDAKFRNLIPDIAPPAGATPDARLANVTVRQLLQHTGGWDKDIPVDHVVQFTAASRALGVNRSAVTPLDMVRYALGQRLDFDPGTQYSYSQTGYLILGRIIEKVTGKKYEDAVRETLFAGSGAASMKLGHALPALREAGEVRYYDYPGAPLTNTPVVPGAAVPATGPYGNFWVEQSEAYGGWIGNAVDLMKYINALEGRRGPSILNAASLAAIAARPAAPVGQTGNFVGLTWRITPLTSGAHWWHTGGATGTRNVLARRQNNRDWVVLMNMRPQDEETIVTEIFTAMSTAETQVRTWPTHDLFADFAGPAISLSTESVEFNHVLGSGAPAAQTLRIGSTGNLPYTVAAPATAPWLKLDRTAGTTPGAIALSVEPAGLALGDYSTLLTVTAPGSANSPRVIRVILRVTSAPVITVRNAASREVTAVAAPESRLVLEREGLEGLSEVTVLAGQRPATVAASGKGMVDVVLPGELAMGETEVSLLSAGIVVGRGKLTIEPVSPGLFAADGMGKGVARGRVFFAGEDGAEMSQPLFQCEESCTALPIELAAEGPPLTLELEATGLRGTDAASDTASIGEEQLEVLQIAASPTTPGVDLVWIRLPRSLAARGETSVTVSAGGKASNAVDILIR